jgi:hypothetical protein
MPSCAISLLSVLRTTFSLRPELIATLAVQANNGSPDSKVVFLFGILFDPDLAGIKINKSLCFGVTYQLYINTLGETLL